MSKKDYYPEYSPISSGTIFIDKDGFLALAWGWDIDKERPVYKREVYVSKLRVDSKAREQYSPYPDYVGKTVTQFQGNYGRVDFSTGSSQWIDFTDWDRQWEEEPIKKPRDGKDYEWRWTPNYYFDGGRYVKHYTKY